MLACLQAGGNSCQGVTAADINTATQQPQEQGPADETQGGPVASLADKQLAVSASMLEPGCWSRAPPSAEAVASAGRSQAGEC